MRTITITASDEDGKVLDHANIDVDNPDIVMLSIMEGHAVASVSGLVIGEEQPDRDHLCEEQELSPVERRLVADCDRMMAKWITSRDVGHAV
jgi:hypothetical protein